MTEIVDQLWIGEDFDSHDLSAIQSNNIGCVINCTKTCVDFHKDLPQDILAIRIPVNDNNPDYHDVLFRYLPFAVQTIYDTINNGRAVLIHCLSGRQRSSCVVASYLIWRYGYSIDEAINIIREKRPQAFTPKVNFMRVLEWWKCNCSDTSNTP